MRVVCVSSAQLRMKRRCGEFVVTDRRVKQEVEHFPALLSLFLLSG